MLETTSTTSEAAARSLGGDPTIKDGEGEVSSSSEENEKVASSSSFGSVPFRSAEQMGDGGGEWGKKRKRHRSLIARNSA